MVLFGRESEPKEEETIDRVNIPLFQHAHLYSANPTEQVFEETAYEPISDPTLEERRYVRQEQTESLAKKVYSAPVATLRTEVPSFDSIRPTQNGLSERSENLDEILRLERIVPRSQLSAESLAMSGTRRAVRKVRLIREAMSDYFAEKKDLINDRRRAVTGIGAVAISAAKVSQETIKGARDKIEMLYKINGPEFLGKHQKKLLIGGIALLGAGLSFGAAEAYITNDFHLAHFPNAVEHVNQHANILAQNQPTVPKEFAITLPRPNHIIAHIDKHAAIHTINHVKHSVMVKAGDGYTQVIQKLFPNRTPAEYLQVYKESISKLGPGFIKHIHHYRMANGFYGLSGSHKAEISQADYRTLSNFFEANR